MLENWNIFLSRFKRKTFNHIFNFRKPSSDFEKNCKLGVSSSIFAFCFLFRWNATRESLGGKVSIFKFFLFLLNFFVEFLFLVKKISNFSPERKICGSLRFLRNFMQKDSKENFRIWHQLRGFIKEFSLLTTLKDQKL